jgi:hypothetical protein
MPDELRNSTEWKTLLPLAAGTGRDLERERLDIILDHMWGQALPLFQPLATKYGFGTEWQAMCKERTAAAARAAFDASKDISPTVYAAANAASSDATNARMAPGAIIYAAHAADAAAYAASYVAAARYAAAAAAAAAASASITAWTAVDPVGLLRRLIEFQPK